MSDQAAIERELDKDRLLTQANDLIQRLMGHFLVRDKPMNDREAALGRAVMDWIEEYEGWGDDECDWCAGAGSVRVGAGPSEECIQCNGTGVSTNTDTV